MKVGTTDGAGRDLDDGISRMLNGGIGNRIDADIAFTVPTECTHGQSPFFEGTRFSHLARAQRPRESYVPSEIANQSSVKNVQAVDFGILNL
jgi:hypothetical protein